MRMFKRLLIASLLIGVVITISSFISRNGDPIRIDVLSYQTEPFPKYLVLLGAFFSGAIIAALILIGDNIRKSMRISKLERQLVKSETRLARANKVLQDQADGTDEAEGDRPAMRI